MSKGKKVKQLQTTVLRSSKGRKVSDGDILLVNYYGTLLSTGETFDGNFNFTSFEPPVSNYFSANGSLIRGGANNTPYELILGSGQVIDGWDQGLKNRRLGEVVDLKIPAKLAYGDQERPGIPVNSDLRFQVELLASIPKGKNQPSYPKLSDINVDVKKLGLGDGDLSAVNQIKIGLNGSDRLIGDNTADLLIGLKGNDRLMGAGGADLLIGGPGKNRFLYLDSDDSPDAKGERDRILGFAKKDKIHLRALADELQFIGSKKFTGAAGDVRFKKGLLAVDTDGDRAADFAVNLSGITELQPSNLIL